MICNLPDTKETDGRAAWAEYLEENMPSCDGIIDDRACAEIINGVAAYLDRNAGGGVVREELLPRMFLRAVAGSCGDSVAAAVLERECSAGVAALDLEFLGSCPSALREFIVAGWMCPLGGEVYTPGQNWLLDLSPVALRIEFGFELLLFRELRCVLESIAVAWDASGGRGILAVKGLRHIVRRICGESKWVAQQSRLALEIRTFSEDLLAHLSVERHWETRPDVVIRDFND